MRSSEMVRSFLPLSLGFSFCHLLFVLSFLCLAVGRLIVNQGHPLIEAEVEVVLNNTVADVFGSPNESESFIPGGFSCLSPFSQSRHALNLFGVLPG